MADHASDHVRGDMEIDEQNKTFHLFMGMTKWGSLYVAAVVLWATVTFCTDAGFMGGLVSTVALIVLGTLLLAEKKKPAH